MEKRSVRTVLITGCSDGGLGAALAIAFHKHRWYRVFATARNTEKMAHLQSLGIDTLELDVTSHQANQMTADAQAETGAASALPRVPGLFERLEDAFMHAALDADARVLDTESQAPIRSRPPRGACPRACA